MKLMKIKARMDIEGKYTVSEEIPKPIFRIYSSGLLTNQYLDVA
jgi:hypothetical protein